MVLARTDTLRDSRPWYKRLFKPYEVTVSIYIDGNYENLDSYARPVSKNERLITYSIKTGRDLPEKMSDLEAQVAQIMDAANNLNALIHTLYYDGDYRIDVDVLTVDDVGKKNHLPYVDISIQQYITLQRKDDSHE